MALFTIVVREVQLCTYQVHAQDYKTAMADYELGKVDQVGTECIDNDTIQSVHQDGALVGGEERDE